MIDNDCVKMDDICIKILKAIGVSSSDFMYTTTILSRMDQHLNTDELQDRLQIIEDKWGYVETDKRSGVGKNDVYGAKLTALGRQFLADYEKKHLSPS